MLRRSLLVTGLALALVLVAGTAALADPTEGVGQARRTGPDTVYLEASSPGHHGARARGGDSGCVATNLGARVDLGGQNINHMGGDKGAFYDFATCTNGTLNGLRWIGAGNPPPPSPAQLAQLAWDNLKVPAPEVHTSPPAGQDAVVNLPTWLWVGKGGGPATASTSAGPVTVNVTATPAKVVWDMGDGTTVTCTGLGTPYVPGVSDPKAASPDCGHTYTRSSAATADQRFRITATVTWTASYSVTGAAGGGALPDLTASSVAELRVAEFQALNTSR